MRSGGERVRAGGWCRENPGSEPARPAPTTSTPSPAVVPLTAIDTNPTDFIGTWSSDLASSGSNTSYHVVNLSTAGTDSITNVNGQAIETKTPPPANGGWVSTTINTDLTKTVDTFVDGLLAEEQNQTASGSDITKPITYGYDGLRRLTSTTDFSGTTTYSYFQDGTQQAVTEPGHTGGTTVSAIDPGTNAATQTQRPDTQSVNTPQNPLGQTSAQFGAGVLPATLGYDSTGTGQLTSLTTYRGSATFSGTTISGSGAATTGWGIDPATGQVTSQTNADNSTYQYQFNSKFQLANVIEPGITGSSFGYNNAGQLASASLTDATTGKVASNVSAFDELGRPLAIANSDNGRTYTTLQTFDDHQRPKQTMFGSAGNATVNYEYAATDSNVSTESRGDLKTMTLKAGNGTTLAATSYGYDSSSKRLSTISVNGTTFTFNYFTDSNQINSVVATVSGGANVTTTYLRDSADKSRIAQVGVQSGNSAVGQVFQEQAVSNGAYPSNGFNQQDQIVGQTTTRKDVADDGTLSSSASKDYLYTYDPNKDDALATVKDGATNTTLYSYALDNIGNRTGTSLGAANSVNDYSNLTYNSRHDLIDDGTNAYGWDAQDRMISVTPDSPTTGSQEEKMAYNSQSQMLWQNVYAWNTTTSAWELSRAEHFVYDGSNLTAELDQSNALLKSYAWGPTGLIAETDFPADPANPNPSAGATTYQVISDLNANVLELVDPATGSESASYHYGPFGEGRTASGPAKDVNPYGFGGGWTDKISGLIYFQHRWFSPTQGRFLSEDPNGTNGGLNTDAYSANDPINKRDSSGLADDAFLKQHGLTEEAYQQFATWVGNKYHIQDPGIRFDKAELLIRTTGGASLGGLTPQQIADLAEHRESQALNATDQVLNSGYDGSKGMAGFGSAVLQGVANAGQSLLNVVAQTMNGDGMNDLGIPLSKNDRISMPDVTEGKFANEYGGHQASVATGEFGWNFAGPMIFQKGAGLFTSAFNGFSLPSFEGSSVGTVSGDGWTAAGWQRVMRPKGMIYIPFGSANGGRMAVQEGLESGALSEATARQAGVVAPPDHHIFPQSYRSWFDTRGINVDAYTVTLDEATHGAIHYGGGPGQGGGWWNDTLMQNLHEREAILGRMLTPDEIMGEGQNMLKQAKLDQLPIHPWNSTK